MIYSLDELEPGSIVEFDGQLLLIEDLRLRLLGLRISAEDLDWNDHIAPQTEDIPQ